MELWDQIFVIHFLLRPSNYTMSVNLPVHKTVCGNSFASLAILACESDVPIRT